MRSCRTSRNGFIAMIGMGAVLFASICMACLTASPALAGTPNDPGHNGRTDSQILLQIEAERHAAELKRIDEYRQRTGDGGAELTPDSARAMIQANEPAPQLASFGWSNGSYGTPASSPAPAVVSDCGCLQGLRCTCGPTCNCRAVSTVQFSAPVPLTQTVRTTAGGYVATSNQVDHRGRRVVQYSGGRYEKRLAKHAVRGIKLGVE